MGIDPIKKHNRIEPAFINNYRLNDENKSGSENADSELFGETLMDHLEGAYEFTPEIQKIIKEIMTFTIMDEGSLGLKLNTLYEFALPYISEMNEDYINQDYIGDQLEDFLNVIIHVIFITLYEYASNTGIHILLKIMKQVHPNSRCFREIKAQLYVLLNKREFTFRVLKERQKNQLSSPNEYHLKTLEMQNRIRETLSREIRRDLIKSLLSS